MSHQFSPAAEVASRAHSSQDRGCIIAPFRPGFPSSHFPNATMVFLNITLIFSASSVAEQEKPKHSLPGPNVGPCPELAGAVMQSQ